MPAADRDFVDHFAQVEDPRIERSCLGRVSNYGLAIS